MVKLKLELEKECVQNIFADSFVVRHVMPADRVIVELGVEKTDPAIQTIDLLNVSRSKFDIIRR